MHVKKTKSEKITFSIKVNPEWKKQMRVVEREIKKLSKIEYATINVK